MSKTNLSSDQTLEELRRKLDGDNRKYVFGRMDMHADSYAAGAPTLLSLHETIEGAIEAIPENLRSISGNIYDDYVVNYHYQTIKKIWLQR